MNILVDSSEVEAWVRHALFACAGLLVLTLISLGYFLGGYFRLDPVEFFLIFGLSWVVQVGLFWLIKSGRSADYSDPALTAPFMVLSTSLILFLSYCVEVGDLSGGTRLSLMMMFFGVLLFGSLRSSRRWFYSISILTSIGYGFILYDAFMDVELSKGITESVELVQLVMFFLLVMIFSKTGSAISMLQSRLHKENVALEANTARIRDLAIHDDLTGLFNRRHVIDVLREQKQLADSGGYAFSVGYMDLDHFKRVNDTYGHGVGDVVLRRFAEIIRASLREVDYAGRLGGEEFVVILADTRLADALVVMERIRKGLLLADFAAIQSGLKVTASIGATDYAPEETVESLLGRADVLLYRAKQGGRNCVVSNETVLEGALPVG